MTIDTPQKREVVTGFVESNPEMSSSMMGRILFKKYPDWFSTENAAYCAVRGRRGAQGRSSFKTMSKLYQKRTGFKWTMPKSISEPWEPFILPQGVTLSLSDPHVPYHDDNALEAALCYGDTLNNGKGPDTVLINGDGTDFFAISRFEKDPRKRSLASEIRANRSFLGCVRQRYRKANVLFKEGNHDERWEKWQWEKCPEYLDIPQMQLESILTSEIKETDKFEWQPAIDGITFIKDQRMIMAGKLAILHGHEFPKGMASPVNPARGNFMRGMECSLAGHLHRTSEHVEPTMFGRVISCWSQGCLCGLHPEYARINKWNHGFAVITLKGEHFDVNNLRIIKGKVYG